MLLHALVRLGETGRAEQTLGGLRDEDGNRGEIRVAEAVLRLAQDDPRAATAALAPVLDGSAPVVWPNWLVSVFVLEAIVRDALSDRAAACRALERALDIAEPDRMLFPFLIYRRRGCWSATPGTAPNTRPWLGDPHPAYHGSQAPLNRPPIGIRGPRRYWEAGSPPVAKSGLGRSFPRADRAVSRSEMRVLRYLPTNLSAPEIARELSVSVTTVRTHISHLFVKLGAHRRTEAVARARDLGLLAPSPMRRAGQPRATVLMPGPTLLGVNVATTWPTSALAPAWRTTTHAGAWVGGPDFARLGGPTALGITSANTLTPVNHHNYTMQTHLAGHDAWKCPSKTGRSIRQPRLSSAAARPLPCISFSDEDREGDETMAEQTGPVWYEIRVRGLLGEILLGAFPGMRARADEKETVLCGPVADQAALHGVLAEIEALGLESLDLRRTRD